MHPVPVAAALATLLTLGPVSVEAQRIGEFTFGVGMAQGLEGKELGARIHANTSFSVVASSFSLGPEFQYVSGTPHIYGYGLVGRFLPGGVGSRGYIVGSLGGNSWRQENFVSTNLFSGSIGAGVLLDVRGKRDRLAIEARFHDNLQNVGGLGNWAFVTVTGSVRVGW
jgi:hypothetical protein